MDTNNCARWVEYRKSPGQNVEGQHSALNSREENHGSGAQYRRDTLYGNSALCLHSLTAVGSVEERSIAVQFEPASLYTRIGFEGDSHYTNAISAITLKISYTAASQILLESRILGSVSNTKTVNCEVNAIALLTLGLSLLVQTLIIHACFFGQSRRILTWSSDLSDIAKACLHDRPTFRHQPGRCLRSASERSADHVGPAQPFMAQPSLRETDPCGRYAVRILWALVPVILLWVILIKVFERKCRADVNAGNTFGT